METPLTFTIIKELRRKDVAKKHLILSGLAATVHVLATITMLTAAPHAHKKTSKWVATGKAMHNMQRHKKHRKGLDLPFTI